MSDPVIRLNPGETAIVGYGSLLCAASVGRTLGREYDGPFVYCRIEGWRRAWDVSMPNTAFYYEDNGERVYPEKILYLNAQAAPGEVMNVVVFVVNERELKAMHDREWIYDPTRATDNLRGLRIEGGDAVIYVARKERVVSRAASPKEAAIRSSYLDIIERALDRVEPSFRAEYERTTVPPPPHLVIDDALDPDRPNPWKSAGRSLLAGGSNKALVL